MNKNKALKEKAKKGRKKMSEAVTEPVVEKERPADDVKLEIYPSEDGQSLSLSVRAPILAEIVRKMAPGNYRKEEYAKLYEPLFVPLAQDATRVVTRPAICKATKNFAPATDFDWEQPPRPILISNPDKLAEGYTISIKLEKPVPPEVLRRWGKQFMDGCSDIIQNARPFKMSWVMERVQ